MGYLNPILSFGIKNFFKSAKNAGTDGLIVVDVPPEEDDEIFNAAKENNIDLIKLATPTTNSERLKTILKTCSGFLYYVSIKGITGAKSADPKIVKNAINNIKKNIVQIPSPKVTFFCTFLKIDLKIRIFEKFQSAVKIALVDEFK